MTVLNATARFQDETIEHTSQENARRFNHVAREIDKFNNACGPAVNGVGNALHNEDPAGPGEQKPQA
jgi:hypothetical protein